MLHTPWTAAFFGLMINLPFGYWRASSRKLSVAWFLAIHIPVILTIALRFLLGVPFHFYTVPLYVAAFCGGQYLGGRLALCRHTGPANT